MSRIVRDGDLRFLLILPQMRVGNMTPGHLVGVDLERMLEEAGVLDGAVMDHGRVAVYPLAIPDGVEVVLPISAGGALSFLRGLEITLGNDGGRLRLTLPNAPLVVPMVQSALADWIADGPGYGAGTVSWWLRLRPAASASVPLGPMGAVRLRVPE